MSINIRVMADYHSYPLWDIKDQKNISPKELQLSEDLQARLMDWAFQYDSTLNMSNPLNSGFVSGDEKTIFDQEGFILAKKIKKELGSGVYVEYFSETTREFIEIGEAAGTKS